MLTHSIKLAIYVLDVTTPDAITLFPETWQFDGVNGVPLFIDIEHDTVDKL